MMAVRSWGISSGTNVTRKGIYTCIHTVLSQNFNFCCWKLIMLPLQTVQQYWCTSAQGLAVQISRQKLHGHDITYYTFKKEICLLHLNYILKWITKKVRNLPYFNMQFEASTGVSRSWVLAHFSLIPTLAETTWASVISILPQVRNCCNPNLAGLAGLSRCAAECLQWELTIWNIQ